MPRNSRAKKQPESPAGEPVAVADTLETLKEEIPSLKTAADLPRQLPPATPEPHADLPPPEQEIIQPDPNTARPRPGPLNGTEHQSFTSKVIEQRQPMQPVPQGFQNVSRHVEAGIRVNKSLDRRIAAIQFAEDRLPSRAEKDVLEALGQNESQKFEYKPATRQWERQASEAYGANVIEATRIAAEMAREREGRGRLKTLHDGSRLILKQDGDTLILDIKLEGRLTTAQIHQIDRLMAPADEDSWFGEASKRAEVEALVKKIDGPREELWTSRAEQARAEQQRAGGR